MFAHNTLGTASLEMGEFTKAKAHLLQAVALYVEHDRELVAWAAADVRATRIAFMALALWALGYPDQAVAARDQAFVLAEQVNHANTTALVYLYGGAELSSLLSRMDDVNAHVQQLNVLSHERMPHWVLLGQIMTGWALANVGQAEKGLALMQLGINTGETQWRVGEAERQSYPYGIHWPHYLSRLALLQAWTGNKQDSLSTIERAGEMIADTGEYLWHSDVLRIKGELRLLTGAPAKHAEACLVSAIEVARKQEAKSFELRAATSLAQLWRDQGRTAGARDLLVPICSWFTEGFDTLDLKRAKALLAELGECISTI
jgi:predicted ATPase